MKLHLENFGGFTYTETAVYVADWTASNGAGKTTLLNAYIFALTGRTLNGFEPRRTGTPDSEPTTVIIYDAPSLPLIRRTYLPTTGSILYVNENATTQTDFVHVCAERGIDIEFAALCADTNLLTNPALTSEDLRKLLVRADVMDGGESEALRKTAKEVRAKKKTAEQYALSNVSVPQRTVEPLNEAERAYLREFYEAHDVYTSKCLGETCPKCGQMYSEQQREDNLKRVQAAETLIQTRQEEARRLHAQAEAYDEETQMINDAERLLATAAKARADVQRYDAQLKEIDETLRDLDALAVRTELPAGVALLTDKMAKTGTTKSVCTLLWYSVPLKSVNRAKRIEICVTILANARERKGMQDWPIIIDNAESIQGLDDVPNLIRLSVG